MSIPPILRIEVDGRTATETDLRVPAFTSYGHFTAMQVSGGRVRGLRLHLARLDAATKELFGSGLDGERVRELIRHALGGDITDASVRVYVHWPEGDEKPVLMVTVRPPAVPNRAPQALMSVPHLRTLPHIKHLGGFGQHHYGRLAARAGFDEALLTGPGGLVAEGSITNIAFYDGTSVVWPDAPALDGITMLLLEDALPAAGLPSVRRPVTLAGLSAYRAAFVTNSQGVAPVSRIDAHKFALDDELMRTVRRAYEDASWDPI